MANNYRVFSQAIEGLTPEACEWLETVMNMDPPQDAADDALAAELGLACTDKLVEQLQYWPDFEWAIHADRQDDTVVCTLEFSSEGHGDDQHIAWLVQALIKRFMPNYTFALSTSLGCSKLRYGEFGGGWMVVTKEAIKGGNTWDSIETCIKELKSGKAFKPTNVYDVLDKLREVGTDSEADVVTELAITAGYLWRCEGCGWVSPAEDSVCPQCGGKKGETDED
jgi:hypothetical protein